MLTKGYVYHHQQDTGEEIIDTWGVAVADDNGECFLCPDVSMDRKEAEMFAILAVAKDVQPGCLQAAANAYIETLADAFP